jgi:2-haloacid dehalogenase
MAGGRGDIHGVVMHRRTFLHAAGALAIASACERATPSARQRVPSRSDRLAPIRAIAFDLFTIFDPRGIDRRLEELIGPSAALAATWKARLFEYAWIRAAAGQYVDFAWLVRDSLAHATRAHGIEIDDGVRRRLEAAFVELEAWPDARATLAMLRASGLRLAPLANFAPGMIDALLEHAGLDEAFDERISTDRARTYKPDPRAYALGESVLRLPRSEIAFAAFGGWDAAGAQWFGYPTFWVNRLSAATEELVAVESGLDLAAFAEWITARNAQVPS